MNLGKRLLLAREKRDSKTSELLFAYADALDVNPRWMLTGEGESWLDGKPDKALSELVDIYRKLDHDGRDKLLGNALRPAASGFFLPILTTTVDTSKQLLYCLSRPLQKEIQMHQTEMEKQDKALVLRTCAADGASYGGFVWPLEVGATVTCPDWNSKAECGRGLHGLLWGAGDGSLLSLVIDAKWLVCEIALSKTVMLGGKCKFPECTILFVGDRKSATDYLLPRVAHPEFVVGAFFTGGDRATLTGGYGATLTGGYGAELRIRWYDHKYSRDRTSIAYVGEDGIQPNVAYRLDENHKFVEAK